MKVKTKLFLSAIAIVAVTLTFFYIIKMIFRPKVAFIEDDNKLVTKIESPTGHIYYDTTSENINARLVVIVINNDSKMHRVTFIVDSHEYKQYNFINSDFRLSGIYEWSPEDLSNVVETDGRFIGEKEIILQANEKKYLTIRATANFGGVKDYRRAGPPIELKILE